MEFEESVNFEQESDAKAEAQHMSLETGTAYVVEDGKEAFPIVIYWDGWAFYPELKS